MNKSLSASIHGKQNDSALSDRIDGRSLERVRKTSTPAQLRDSTPQGTPAWPTQISKFPIQLHTNSGNNVNDPCSVAILFYIIFYLQVEMIQAFCLSHGDPVLIEERVRCLCSAMELVTTYDDVQRYGHPVLYVMLSETRLMFVSQRAKQNPTRGI